MAVFECHTVHTLLHMGVTASHPPQSHQYSVASWHTRQISSGSAAWLQLQLQWPIYLLGSHWTHQSEEQGSVAWLRMDKAVAKFSLGYTTYMEKAKVASRQPLMYP